MSQYALYILQLNVWAALGHGGMVWEHQDALTEAPARHGEFRDLQEGQRQLEASGRPPRSPTFMLRSGAPPC